MKDRYFPVEGVISNETDAAYLLQPAEFDLDGQTHEHNQLWVPKSNTHPDGLDKIDAAFRGDLVEVYVAEWWLREQ